MTQFDPNASPGGVAAGAGAGESGQVDVEFLGECAGGWGGPQVAIRRVRGGAVVCAGAGVDTVWTLGAVGTVCPFAIAAGVGGLDELFVARGYVAYDGACVRRWRASVGEGAVGAGLRFELDQGCAGFDDVTRLPVEGFHNAGERCWHLDDRFRCFDSEHRLVDGHCVADIDMPTHDFRLGEAFAEIREIEDRHLRSVRSQPCGVIPQGFRARRPLCARYLVCSRARGVRAG